MSAKRNKGITLIGAMISIFIVVIIIMTVALGFSSRNKTRNSMEETLDGVYKMESIKKLLICNYSYEEIANLLKDKKCYIDHEDLSTMNFNQINIGDILQEEPGEYPRVEIQGTEGQGGTMIINISYYFHGGNKMENIFYKGNYEEDYE